ncbi:MAG: DMT family transporter [Bacteroidales bacterium]|jgi:drug/metabolite transporter (DMT)-like permease|nr:DMT family transporter [Bacteroidales bacterium]
MNDRNYKAHLAILTTNIIFGINTPISKNVLQEYLSPFSLTFFRMAGACVVFWLVSLFMKTEKIKPRDLLFIFLASMFGIFINQFSFIQGLSLTTPVNAAIIITCTPIMTMIVSFLFLKEPITFKKAGGVFLGASGTVILVLSGYSGTVGAGNIWGNLLCLVSSLAYAIYLTAFKWLIDKYSPVSLMKWMFLFATIVSLPFTFESVSQVNFAEMPLIAYLQIAYIVVGATFTTYLLIPIGQKGLRPTTLTMYNYLQPLVTTIIAVIFGLDTFGFVKTIAAVMIFLGVYIVMKSKSRAQLEIENKKST